MKIIEILLQGEAIPDIQVVVIEAEQAKAHHVIAKAAEHRKSPVEGEFFVFIEDEELPLDPDCVLPEPGHGHPLRLHVHRCRAIAVAVTFNGETVDHRFGPGTTVETVKKWAALSPLFQKMMAYAQSLKPQSIFILSAKYGLLSTDTVTPRRRP